MLRIRRKYEPGFRVKFHNHAKIQQGTFVKLLLCEKGFTVEARYSNTGTGLCLLMISLLVFLFINKVSCTCGYKSPESGSETSKSM